MIWWWLLLISSPLLFQMISAQQRVFLKPEEPGEVSDPFYSISFSKTTFGQVLKG